MSGADVAVGIECADRVIRAVLLDADSGPPAHAAEVSLQSTGNDRAVLDAFVRLRAELGGPTAPARIALFPSGSSLYRIDVTGQSGPELNTLRSDVARRTGVPSSLLVDDGPRRWLFIVDWPVERVRRFETLAERAGFLDVAVEPSPIALARSLRADVALARRAAAPHESFLVAYAGNIAVAATTSDAVGLAHPALDTGHDSFSVPMFDGLTDSESIAEQLAVVHAATATFDGCDHDIRLRDDEYPPFPPHDLRAPERQCVALGAAIGAAGIGGSQRPVDIIAPSDADAPLSRRPWTIERVSTVPTAEPVRPPGPAKRTLSRLRPRRR